MNQRAAALSQTTLLADALAVVAATALTALAAQVSLPYTPVPQTLQTMAVLGTACALGLRRAGAAQLLYLALGAGGLPVFAAGQSGLSGVTAGYLVGFVLAALVAGGICDRLGRGFYVTVPAMVLASVPLYLCGLSWLKHSLPLTWTATLHAGLTPFLVGDALKILAAAALLDPAAPWGAPSRAALSRLGIR
jgi:biotin transport system substrate-specific component